MSVQMRRRLLLFGSGMAFCISGLGLAWWKREGIERRLVTPALDNWLGPHLSRRNAPLSGTELQTVLALADCVYPCRSDAQLRELRSVVTRWSQERTMDDELHPLYAAAARALNDLAIAGDVSADFAALPLRDRLLLLIGLDRESGSGGLLAAPARAFRRLQRRETRVLTSMLRRDLIKGIYSSHLGWQLTGNRHTWPGVPGDPAMAARPPSV